MSEIMKIHTEKIQDLVRNIIKDERFQDIENIYGIPKGGIPFAVTIANFSHKPLILKTSQITDKTLVVDDIVDSGETLTKFQSKRFWENITPVYAVIITKINEINREARKLLTFSGYEIDDEAWIVFPWEDPQNITKKLDGTEIE